VIAVFSALSFGVSWTPAMSFVTESAERIGVDVAWGVALINLAWAPGQALGALGGGTLARATSDAVPYLLLSAACLLTLAAVIHSSRARDVARGASEPAAPG
jgi:predicted MFS family arabinose efflux permease